MIPGRLLLPALRWRDDTGFGHEAATIAAALEFGAGGFIFFGGRPEAVARLTAELVDRAGRPLLLAADLERGAGQQFPGLTEFPPPAALASLHDPDAIRCAAATTAREARSLGINWVLAPDADLDVEPDNPIVQTRSFGADPDAVGRAVATWVRACQHAGALACIKHFPGHGRTKRDSHDEVPVVAADAAILEATDLVPFRQGIEAGVAAVMTGHLSVPALDPSGTPATFSAPILRTLRHDLGFDGLIVTDALMMGAAVRAPGPLPAVRALAAGCDVLCYPADPVAEHGAIVEALRSGLLTEALIADAVARYQRTLAAVPPLRRAERGTGGEVIPPLRFTERGPGGEVDESQRGPGGEARLRAPIELIVVDDDQGGAWPASPNDWTEKALRAAGVPLGKGGSRVVLAFAEPRASKGRSGFGAASLAALGQAAGADLMVLFAHPRLGAQLPGTAPVLVAWHRQRLMQEAAARWIRRHTA